MEAFWRHIEGIVQTIFIKFLLILKSNLMVLGGILGAFWRQFREILYTIFMKCLRILEANLGDVGKLFPYYLTGIGR